MERGEPARIPQAQHDPDAAAVADHDGRQHSLGPDVLHRGAHALLLLLQRLSLREPERLRCIAPRPVAVRLLARDVDEPPALPAAPAGLPQPRIQPRREPNPLADDLAGLARPG